MTNIRRYFRPGNVYFLTHVTEKRAPILVENQELLLHAIETVKKRIPSELLAWVILPDHWHIIINPEDQDLSGLIRRIKLSFSMSYRKRHKIRRGRIWQYRFWDHVIRDEADLNKHIDYIHYNPVKHGCVENPFDYELSSIHKYVKMGYYQGDWDFERVAKLEGEFGE